jgi:hypothetical protein
MDRTQTWNCPIIVLKAPDGIRTASGVEPSVRCCLIEGHQQFRYLAGGLGFEPRLTESESAVLPLNYPPTRRAGTRWLYRGGEYRSRPGLEAARPEYPRWRKHI